MNVSNKYSLLPCRYNFIYFRLDSKVYFIYVKLSCYLLPLVINLCPPSVPEHPNVHIILQDKRKTNRSIKFIDNIRGLLVIIRLIPHKNHQKSACIFLARTFYIHESSTDRVFDIFLLVSELVQ